MPLEEIIAKILVIVWGFGGIYLVWGMKQNCPSIYPLIFGGMSGCFYFLTHKIPLWFPDYLTVEFFRVSIYILGILTGIMFLILIIEKHDLDSPLEAVTNGGGESR